MLYGLGYADSIHRRERFLQVLQPLLWSGLLRPPRGSLFHVFHLLPISNSNRTAGVRDSVPAAKIFDYA